MATNRKRDAEPGKPRFWLTYTDPPGPATATTVRPADVPGSQWPGYLWPSGDEKAAGVFVEPEASWREPLERWLGSDYTWPDQPNPETLRRVLMKPPFNRTDFDTRLPIGMAMDLLEIHSPAVDPLILDVAHQTVVIGDDRWPLTDEQCNVLNRIIDQRGGVIPSGELKQYAGSQEKPHKIIAALPGQVQGRIGRRRGSGGGYWIIGSAETIGA